MEHIFQFILDELRKAIINILETITEHEKKNDYVY